MIEIAFLEQNGFQPRIRWGEQPDEHLDIWEPVTVHDVHQPGIVANYTTVARINGAEWLAKAEWNSAGYRFTLEDRWVTEENRIRLHRHLVGIADPNEKEAGQNSGIQLQLKAAVPSSPDAVWRFCAPATEYSGEAPLTACHRMNVYMDDRLTYPFILAYEPERKRYFTLARVSLPERTNPPLRTEAKENRYLQKTEVGSVGYAQRNGHVLLKACWPYYEGERSVALNARLTPVSAFYPLDEPIIEQRLEYELRFGQSETFADAVYETFRHYAAVHPPKPANLPFSLEDSIEYRCVSLGRCYRELENGGAGFFFHFDPRHGYGSQPSGFGTGFNNIPHETYTHILEYGFTGRQINAAYTMAKLFGGEWLEKGKRVVDFFVERLAQPSGFLYSLYDLKRNKPFASFGEKDAPKLHYISHGNIPGNYLRTMVEPAFDLLLVYRYYESQGWPQPSWWEATRRFARFLLRLQNEDGSWYRAYEPDGTPLKYGEGFGHDEVSAKSASSIPILYLLEMSREDKEDGPAFLKAARKAGDFVLKTYVSRDYYLGGTLDNPNVVDKEAAQYTMAALYGLYKFTGETRYLDGAVRAGKLFVTWNYIWNAPHFAETVLGRLNFHTVGTGGINSIWGGGVVDIYSLFHIEELDRLGAEAGESFFRDMARWIAIGTQQILSHPNDLMGFADIGMQPEGFGICNQGIDEGMIAKGDIWGTLGWIYSAGIFGLGKYLNYKGLSTIV